MIVDHGVGNLASVLNMLKKAGAEAGLASDPKIVAKAEKIILPGVGAFDAAMAEIRRSNLDAALDHAVRIRGVPVLGICLGMQLLTRGSAEGTMAGLGWINASTIKFDVAMMGESLPIPHMGWNKVLPRGPDSILPKDEELRFYFANSYHVVCEDAADVIGVSHYGYDFPSVVKSHNIFGAQFHPEKSHRFGLEVLRRFDQIR